MGCVYFIQAGDDPGPVKIGWTSGRAEDRLATFQTGCPEKLRLLCAWPGGRDLEAAYHRVFAPARIRGEWFRASVAVYAQTGLLTSAWLHEFWEWATEGITDEAVLALLPV